MMKWSDLVGKTISRATHMKFVGYDDEPVLKLEFTDGTSCFIIGGYGGYTGGSEDEYWQFVSIRRELDPNMEPLEEIESGEKDDGS